MFLIFEELNHDQNKKIIIGKRKGIITSYI